MAIASSLPTDGRELLLEMAHALFKWDRRKREGE